MRRKQKKEIRYVCRQGKHMRRKQKKEIRYVCRQGKHMRRKQKRKLGMCAGRENTCVESEKQNQVCMPTGKTHA